MKRLVISLFLALILSSCSYESTEQEANDYTSCDIQKMFWDTDGGGAIEFEIIQVDDSSSIEVMEYEYEDTSVLLQLTSEDSEVYTMVNKIFTHELNLYDETFTPRGYTGTWTSITLTYSNSEEVKINNIKAYGKLSIISEFVTEKMNEI